MKNGSNARTVRVTAEANSSTWSFTALTDGHRMTVRGVGAVPPSPVLHDAAPGCFCSLLVAHGNRMAGEKLRLRVLR